MYLESIIIQNLKGQTRFSIQLTNLLLSNKVHLQGETAVHNWLIQSIKANKCFETYISQYYVL